MAYRYLFVLVEGRDDQRFVEEILFPLARPQYDHMQTYQYAQKTAEQINNLLTSIANIPGDYLMLADYDDGPCISERKNTLTSRLVKLDSDRVVIAKAEIESWYLAGLADDLRELFNIPAFRETEHVTKEQFNHLIPRQFKSRVDYMVEVLRRFDLTAAQRGNNSFRYLCTKYSLFAG